MPLYVTLCPGCSAEGSIFRKIDERDSNLPVCECGQQVDRIIVAPSVRGEIEPYESPKHPGTWITSRAQQREDLKKAGAILWEPGIRKDVERNREHAWRKTEAAVEKRVDETVRDLAVSGRLG